jgi:signal transduction histidine kinase
MTYIALSLRPTDPAPAPRLVLRFALSTGLALAIAAGVVMWFMRDQAVARAERMVEFHTAFVADSTLRSALRPEDFEGPVEGARRAALDRLFADQVLVPTTLGAKLWSPNATVTYSDDHDAVGQVAEPAKRRRLAEVMRGGSFREVSRPADGAKVVEAYVPVQLRSGATPIGVLELDEDYAPVAADVRNAVTPVGLVLGGALLAIWLGLVPMLRRTTAELESRYRELQQSVAERAAAEEARRLSEERLNQAQKMDAVGRLAGGIAHDFNNLLLAINGYSELALARLNGSSPAAREAIAEVRSAGERAARLTRQLLAFSRQEVLDVKPIDVNAVVADLANLLERLLGDEFALALELAPELPTVEADRGRLEQVLLNLVVNARDAMGGGGVVSITTAERRDGGPPEVVLAVADSGSGIAPEVRHKIFEPFFTTKGVGEGTGLGLSTVYGIVEQFGGRIDLETEVGRGTTFTIVLPSAGAVSVDLGDVVESASAGGTERILVVEDDPTVRSFVTEALELSGYHVTAAATPHEALELVSANRSFDLLLTDLALPGMNGHELGRRIRTAIPGLRLLNTSGNPAGVQRDATEPDAFLQKPYSLAELDTAVRDVLDGRPV